MKVISTEHKEFIVDRVTTHNARVIIDIQQTSKDDKAQIFTFKTNDSYITDEGIVEPIRQKETNSQTKSYTKTYAEYQAEKDALISIYGQDPIYIALTTDASKDDYILQKGLLYNLTQDPIYGIAGTSWEEYVEPELAE